MDKEKITIALEPEAASIYCHHLPLEVTGDSGEMSISKLPVGTQYIVIDAGGNYKRFFSTMSVLNILICKYLLYLKNFRIR